MKEAKPPMYVYIVCDDCPAEWGEAVLQRVFTEHKAAVRWMNEQKGKDACGRQYWTVQRWRVYGA